MSDDPPRRGELWWINLGEPVGHEQGGMRHALILSLDAFNRGPAGLAVVLPLSSRAKQIRSHVAVTPSEGGLSERSLIKCEDIRSIPKARSMERIGEMSATALRSVETIIRYLLGL